MAKILIVDDDPDFVEITRTILESTGHEVSAASDGGEALQAMRQDKPDLVLLDVIMSTILEGLNVSHEMQADHHLGDIPVIMFSNIISSPHASLFPTNEHIPIDAWLTKPLDPDDLLEQVQRLLSKRAG
ncbi:MAG: response regulator [Chloroflexota bacterium]|nr:response regulator [Chloroflexota bacterium]